MTGLEVVRKKERVLVLTLSPYSPPLQESKQTHHSTFVRWATSGQRSLQSSTQLQRE
jgi:hypothetical protein